MSHRNETVNGLYRSERTDKVYMDYNATTPLADSVVKIVSSTLTNAWGNPSSSHAQGVYAKSIIEEARCSVTKMVNGNSIEEVIFMSGGTEANNNAIFTAIEYFKEHQVKQVYGNDERAHVITSSIEHDSIAKQLAYYEQKGVLDVTYISICPSRGYVCCSDIVRAVTKATVLITVMMANNETGAVQPIQKISNAVECINSTERAREGLPRILVHTDAAQAIGKIPVDAQILGVDYLTIVGHKFYAPRIGALWVKVGAPFYNMLHGGGQEKNRRSGTENTCMIAGLGEGAKLVCENLELYNAQYKKMLQYLQEKLLNVFSSTNISFNTVCKYSLPNTLNISMKGDACSGRKVLSLCKRSQASVGAACHSDRGDTPSFILLAQGVPLQEAKNALRLSIGRETSINDIDVVVDDLHQAFLTLNAADDK